ncbi:DNA-binding transcriptional regulator domain protein [Shigella flexneri 1485-80]|nr:DNA-binding transcriptional regulator domain protein [Shigella flexneri 1485-80]
MTVETQLNPTQPVNQQIYRILRRDIVHCLIAPGTPLSEKEVSVRFNVSRQPVREAFIKLAENGLIQIRPQRGSYVNKISMAQVRNGSFIRQAIECAVARRAASMITESQCYQLEQNLHQQRIAIEHKQLDDFFELDDNFHQLLTQIADCQLAWDTIENLKATVDRVRYMSFDHVSPPEMLLRQHLDIFSALQKRDGDAVERAMTQHLQEISESVARSARKTATGLAKSNSFTLIPSGMRGFSPRLTAHACIKKDVSLIKNKNISLDRSIYIAPVTWASTVNQKGENTYDDLRS